MNPQPIPVALLPENCVLPWLDYFTSPSYLPEISAQLASLPVLPTMLWPALPSNLPVSHVAIFIASPHHAGAAQSSIHMYYSAISYVHKLRSILDPTVSPSRNCWFQAKNSEFRTHANPLPRTSCKPWCTPFHTCGRHSMMSISSRPCSSLPSAPCSGLAKVTTATNSASTGCTLQLCDVAVYAGCHMEITFQHYKHSHLSNHLTIQLCRLPADVNLCPTTSLTAFLSLRRALPGPLFSLPDGLGISQRPFTDTLRAALAFDLICNQSVIHVNEKTQYNILNQKLSFALWIHSHQYVTVIWEYR